MGKNYVNGKTFLEKRYDDNMELEDAVHTAILTLKEGFEGQVTLQLTHKHTILFNGHYQRLLTFNVTLLTTYETTLNSIFTNLFTFQMSEDNIEIGICNADGFRRLTPQEVKDYLANIA